MKYTRIPVDTFQKLQMNAGVLARNFDPETGEVAEEDLVGATTGGISFSANSEFTDFGEDIDNCPKNIQYQRLKLKDVLQRAIMGAKHPIVVS